MKTLTLYITEKLKISKTRKNQIKVNTMHELRELVVERAKTCGEFLDLTDIDVSDVDEFTHVCSSLNVKKIDITGWNTSNADNFRAMFIANRQLEEIIGIEDLDTSKARSISMMFSHCYNLKELDCSTWKLGKCIEFEGVFNECSSLKEVKGIEDWDISKMRICDGMFKDCDELHADLTHWDISHTSHVYVDVHAPFVKINTR